MYRRRRSASQTKDALMAFRQYLMKWTNCQMCFLMMRRPPRSPQGGSSAASDVYRIQVGGGYYFFGNPDTHQTTVKEQTKQTKPITDTRNTYVVQAAKESGPAVVGITTQVFQKDIFNRTIYAGEGVGSGVLIDNDGHIVTNNHVVAGAKNGEVTVSLSNGSTVTGTVIGTDAQTDLAVVKIDPPKDIQAIKIGDSDSLQVGEPAIAIGNPLGLEFKGSVTSGVISALARTIDDQGQRFPLIQTDAAINPGNSGGALINADGELIGINSSKISKEGVEGMGFAIPINSAMTVVDSIIKNGKVVRPYIGVWAVDRQTAARNNVSYEGEGLLIVQLDANGPAAKAGLVEGDTIAQIDGKNISTLLELKEQIDAKSPGDTVLVSYTHNGKMKSTQLKLGQATSK